MEMFFYIFMKLWFDLQWIRSIGQKYPALARFVEITLYAVVTAIGAQALKVIIAFQTALESGADIVWRDILLNFDWRPVVLAAVIIFQATLNKYLREHRTT